LMTKYIFLNRVGGNFSCRWPGHTNRWVFIDNSVPLRHDFLTQVTSTFFTAYFNPRCNIGWGIVLGGKGSNLVDEPIDVMPKFRKIHGLRSPNHNEKNSN